MQMCHRPKCKFVSITVRKSKSGRKPLTLHAKRQEFMEPLNIFATIEINVWSNSKKWTMHIWLFKLCPKRRRAGPGRYVFAQRRTHSFEVYKGILDTSHPLRLMKSKWASLQTVLFQTKVNGMIVHPILRNNASHGESNVIPIPFISNNHSQQIMGLWLCFGWNIIKKRVALQINSELCSPFSGLVRESLFCCRERITLTGICDHRESRTRGKGQVLCCSRIQIQQLLFMLKWGFTSQPLKTT